MHRDLIVYSREMKLFDGRISEATSPPTTSRRSSRRSSLVVRPLDPLATSPPHSNVPRPEFSRATRRPPSSNVSSIFRSSPTPIAQPSSPSLRRIPHNPDPSPRSLYYTNLTLQHHHPKSKPAVRTHLTSNLYSLDALPPFLSESLPTSSPKSRRYASSCLDSLVSSMEGRWADWVKMR